MMNGISIIKLTHETTDHPQEFSTFTESSISNSTLSSNDISLV